MRKKFLAVVLAAALACNMTGMTAAAQPAVAGLSVLRGLFGQDEGGDDKETEKEEASGKDSSEESADSTQGASSKKEADKVTLDIGQSDIIISKNGITAVDTSGVPVTETSSQYVITGSTQEHAIVVEDGANANIVLSNVNITRTMDGVSPMRIADNSSGTVRVVLEGSNTLQGGPGAAGIQKNCTHTDSSCRCGTLEITCANTEGGHICDARCGTLNAAGSNGAAGIGGGSGVGSSRISVKGGMVTANGGVGGASGGLGSKVTIAGGMVNAGSLNGKASDPNLMNGNTLLFADSATELQTKKGILYQNGAGTVYGSTMLSQGLADYLPEGSTLTIPEGSTLTIDESTVLPNEDNIVGKERLIRKQSKTPTPTPEVTEEPEQDIMLAEEDAVTPEAQARIMVNNTTLELSILHDGKPLEGGYLYYGDQITLQAKIKGENSSTSVNSTGTGFGTVGFFCGGQQLGATRSLPNEPGVDTDVVVESEKILLVENNFPNTNGGLGGSPNVNGRWQLSFKAVYSGGEKYLGSDGNINLIVAPGTLSTRGISGTYTWEPENVDAGITVDKGLRWSDPNLTVPFQSVVENQAGDTVLGKWKWKGTDGSQRLWPSSVKPEYTLQFELDNTNENVKYTNSPYEVTVIPNIRVHEVDSAEILSLTNKSGDWYNASSGPIIATGKNGYTLRLVADAPVKPEDWSTTVGWESSITIPEELDYYNGTYRGLYAWDTGGDRLVQVLIKNFKVDKRYPKISSFMSTTTGRTGYLTFEVDNEVFDPNREDNEGSEKSGSGIKQIMCRTEPRWDTGHTLNDYRPSLDPNVNLAGRVVNGGNFPLNSLSPKSDYDVYVTVEDNAGNKTRYLKWLFDDQGSTIADADQLAGTLVSEDTQDLFYGYLFTTGNPEITGDLKLSVEGKNPGEAAYLDTLVATVDITNDGSPVPKYSWYREDANGKETPINDTQAINRYTVREEDVGCKIICRVETDATSGYLQDKTFDVQKAACPDKDAPQYVSENSLEKTFTFTGNPARKYEYRVKGRVDWTTIDAPNGASEIVLQLSEQDWTIPIGDLEVRTKESDLYKASDPITNKTLFVSTKELEITIDGEPYYGEELTVNFKSDVIMPNDVSYEWTYVNNGSPVPNADGRSHVLQKEDVGKRLQVKVTSQVYQDIDKTEQTVQIRPRPVEPVVNVAEKEYDGTTKADATVSLTGLLGGDSLSGSISVEFPDKKVGEYAQMKVGELKLEGEDQNYYKVSSLKGDIKGTIRPKQLALSMTAQDKVYDGKTDAVVSFTTTAVSGDSIEVAGAGEFADKNAGANKTVTSKDVVITGTDAANYTAAGSSATATASITPKDISIEGISVADKEFDNTTDAVIAVTFAGAVDEVSYTYKASFDTPSVGMDKRVTGTVTLTGDSAANYNLASGDVSGTGNIVKALAPYEESNIPQNLTGVEGKKLSSVFIGQGFTWKDPNTVMEKVGRHTYDALYNPDPSQYGDRPVRIEVLVQCAKHTWGDWTTSVQPTKTELGERRRICSVCGYVEVETVPRAPYITTEDTKEGWGDIIQAINNASSGTEIPVTMNGTETLPAVVQEALQGRDVSLVLQMADGITWTLRGQDITGSVLKDINLAVTIYTDNIPTDVLDPYLKGDKTPVQIHLAYSGEFGFTATLRVPLGNEYAGVNSTFYYYNPNRERLEQMDSNKITSDGIGRYDLTHASDYVAILDAPSSNGGGSASENTPSPGGNNNNPSNTPGGSGSAGQTNTGTNTPTTTPTTAARTTSGNNGVIVSINAAKTSDETPVMNYVMLLMLGAAGAAVIGAYRHNRRKDRSR